MDQERLDFLLNRHFDQALSPEEKQEFARALLESAEARRLFWEFSRWHGAIRQLAEQEDGRHVAPAQVPPPASRLPRVLPQPVAATAGKRRPTAVHRPATTPRAWWPLAAAAAVVLGLLAWMQWNSINPGSKDQAIAVARHASTAIWDDATSGRMEGQMLRGESLKLKSGALQIDFAQGARMVLEGPAEFELLSANSGTLRHGKLMATVPESARGFTVHTPGFSVVDHGTQFGCMVPRAAPPEVHVFQGAVALQTAGRTRNELQENQAVRFAGSQFQAIPPNLDTFLTEEKLARLEGAAVQLENWRRSSRAFSQHPGMLVHFDFEKDARDNPDRVLINRAPNAAPETNGAIEGCEWTEGRWPGKRALKFSNRNDRARLSVPGEHSAVTFVVVARVDGIPFRENSLLRAEHEEKLGEPHWFITGEGAIAWNARAAPRGSANQWLHAFSESVFRGEVPTVWHTLAVVYDGTAVTHYLDGKPVGSSPVRLPGPVRLGRAQVGNGGPMYLPDPATGAITNFSGTIDELAILSVPLTREEIQRLSDDLLPDRPAR